MIKRLVLLAGMTLALAMSVSADWLPPSCLPGCPAATSKR